MYHQVPRHKIYYSEEVILFYTQETIIVEIIDPWNNHIYSIKLK